MLGIEEGFDLCKAPLPLLAVADAGCGHGQERSCHIDDSKAEGGSRWRGDLEALAAAIEPVACLARVLRGRRE